MPQNKNLVGIDPDIDKSGVAFSNGELIELKNLTFFELFEYLKTLGSRTEKLYIYIECGYLNQSNWHKRADRSSAFNAKVGERTGANFETAKKIVEMCEYLKLQHFKIKPTRTKVKASFFKSLTGIQSRTNQEQRDAYMLIHGR